MRGCFVVCLVIALLCVLAALSLGGVLFRSRRVVVEEVQHVGHEAHRVGHVFGRNGEIGGINASVVRSSRKSWFSLLLIVLAIPALMLLGLIFLFASRRKSSGRDSGDETEGERRLVQRIHADLGEMEKRIESLETILIEQSRKE